ncbi:MAG: Ig domain-containing protein, partial [Nitrosopumilaceae archaeon]
MSLRVILVFLLIIFMIVPAYGDVTSFKTDKSVYSIDDKITFFGTSNNPGELVHVAIKNPFGNTVEFRSGVSNSTGHFSLVPITADSQLFDKPGTFEVTAFGDTQQVQNGTRLSLDFSGGKITVLGLFDLKLNTISNKSVDEEKTLSFTVTLTDSTIEDAQFSLENNPPGTSINPTTGKFTWTPNDAQGGITYTLDVVVNAGGLEDRQTITINVVDIPPPAPIPEPTPEPTPEPPQPPPEPTPEPEETGIAAFVDPKQDPQYYVDRYNNEPTYKDWFDRNYPEYSSIYEAVGLNEPKLIPAAFVDPKQDPQYYVDRYN